MTRTGETGADAVESNEISDDCSAPHQQVKVALALPSAPTTEVIWLKKISWVRSQALQWWVNIGASLGI
ncbi:hypothetical protein EXE58_06130 [Nocardioides seonyuensis]|uniref:Uncharacterized protein n=1 Tax=Nocardioides seonyuensis TaxID=2518371 RepID=A0A4P7IET4_9ACTN|nr:hypothetical protein [Nocardioides seonyuensis]QBX55073.1 hypothetical protein EXE58_06130 [Nocardioides seonyuensis]